MRMLERSADELPKLSASEFPEFFRALYGPDKDPFPWQQKLLELIATEGHWPAVLDLPTGSGKTAAIDIALFHLALEADKKANRRAPVRIAFVVDRRVIVDAAFERAVLIQKALADALERDEPDNLLARVARRLIYLSGTQSPLVVRALRGGVPRENDWARTPTQPTILCSTVDQVGSRLLFRGYGVSDSMRPIHAGLLGSDCLILLDEAHLSEPFRQTLAAIKRYRAQPWAKRQPAPWDYVVLTATPATRKEVGFALTQEDPEHPTLSNRLRASKPAKLVKAKARASELVPHAKELVNHAWDLSGLKDSNPQPKIIAVVVNRVALARKCHTVLAEEIRKQDAHAETVLLIGRTREIERRELIERYKDELLSGRPDPKRTLFVVATQCIEAGADFDFDALVTQLAPLDALRQRFGRLNRMGRPIQARAVILACPDEISNRADDPLYGTRAKQTWDALWARAETDPSSAGQTVDFGILQMNAWLQDQDVAALITEPRNGPVVMPSYVELWAQTSDVPAADPEAALFLHGKPDAADVQIIWRSDIRETDVNTPEGVERIREILALMPPRAAEAISVPIRAARAWLSNASAPEVHDVEGDTGEESAPSTVEPRRALRWRGAESEDTRAITAGDLRPGDLIVVPSTYGGCDEYGWRPGYHHVVRDVADAAARPYAKHRFVLRVHRSLLENALLNEGAAVSAEDPPDAEQVWRRMHAVIQQAKDERDGSAVARELTGIRDLPKSWLQPLKALAEQRDIQIVFPYDDESSSIVSGLCLVSPKGIDLREQETSSSDEAVTETDDAGSFRAQSVPLSKHSEHVETKARAFSANACLSREVAQDVALAALLHDEGKRDPRFQTYLRQGDRLLFRLDPEVLAKSDKRFPNRRSEQRARRRSELPDRWRHEADSVRRALEHPKLSEATDRQLVLWLIGTHHGYGRPYFPHTDPEHAGPQDPDFLIGELDWRQLFFELIRRYGAWELARLEAILRLADHRASEEEEER